MERKYNRIEFCQEDYHEIDDLTGESEFNEYEFWEDFKDFMRIAIKNNYQCHVWFDGLTLAVDYNFQDPSISGVSLEWLGEDEYIETFKTQKENNCVDYANMTDTNTRPEDFV